MKRALFLIVACLSIFSGFAQIATDEVPISFTNPAIKLALESQQADLKELPSLDMARIQEDDELDARNGLPPRFGFPHEVAYNLDNSGTWTELENGDLIWQLDIHCAGALSINLLYDQFWLPEQSKLFIYTSDKRHAIGAFTSVNNKGSREEAQGFATGLLYGERITLEYHQPKEAKEKALVSIATVVHGYRYINVPEFTTRNLGSSGSCQVNVNCPEGTNWQQEKNAVALILVGGTRWCTGSLINTTCNNDEPLLLTANHCLLGGDAETNPNLATWSFYWHYESPTCTNPSNEPPHLSTSGATVVANNGNTDFALLRLTEDPKNRNGVTPYYLGWDRSGNAGTGGVGIHHPSGDIKKIATYTVSPASTHYLSSSSNPSGLYWKVEWVATITNHGVTEGGSSGSALINSNKKSNWSTAWRLR